MNKLVIHFYITDGGTLLRVQRSEKSLWGEMEIRASRKGAGGRAPADFEGCEDLNR